MGKMPFYIRHSIVIQFVLNKVELKVEPIIGKVTCLKKIGQVHDPSKNSQLPDRVLPQLGNFTKFLLKG